MASRHFPISVQARAARVPQVRCTEKEWRALRQSLHAPRKRLPMPWGQDVSRQSSFPAKGTPSPFHFSLVLMPIEGFGTHVREAQRANFRREWAGRLSAGRWERYWAPIRRRSMILSTVFADHAAPRAAGTPCIVNSAAIARADRPDMPSRRGRSDSVGY